MKAVCRPVDKYQVTCYYTERAMQSREFPPNLFSYLIRVWPSGKAVDFGSTIPGSNPGTRASLAAVLFLLLLVCQSAGQVRSLSPNKLNVQVVRAFPLKL